MTNFRQAQYREFGPAKSVLELVDIDKPVPHPKTILVRIMASGVNPSDVKKRAGWANMPPPPAPVVPHADGAGIIEAVGDDVDAQWVGKRVWVYNAQGSAGYGIQNGPEAGTAANYAILPMTCVAPLPDNVSFPIGACLGVPAITAQYVIACGDSVKNQTVLVQGGAGAVGELAIQFAALSGARVIATVSSDQKAEIARNAGATTTINRRTEDVSSRVLECAPDGVDRIIEVDFAANAELDAKILKIGGTIVSYSSPSDRHPPIPYYELQMRGAILRLVSNVRIPQQETAQAIEAINMALANSQLRPTIGREFAFEEIAAAHECVESGKTLGQVVVKL